MDRSPAAPRGPTFSKASPPVDQFPRSMISKIRMRGDADPVTIKFLFSDSIIPKIDKLVNSGSCSGSKE
jgi:hypothetical protein